MQKRKGPRQRKAERAKAREAIRFASVVANSNKGLKPSFRLETPSVNGRNVNLGFASQGNYISGATGPRASMGIRKLYSTDKAFIK